jgi:tetratricopeptide (TPR) repeat protein
MAKQRRKRASEAIQTKPAASSLWVLPVFFLGLLALYAPALTGGWLWDDAGHITPYAQSLGGLWRIWTELGATQQYYPLVHSTFWLQSHLWGESTLGYHVLNVGLHAISAYLILRIAQRLEIPGALGAAVFFAVHPVHVESVAWISELKNTMSLALYLGALYVYLRFDRSRTPRDYAIALVLFVLALLSKTVTATLPVVLLIVIWWKRGNIRWRADARPLLPFFVLGTAAGLLTAWVERHFSGAAGAEYDLTFAERLLLAARAAWFYAAKLVAPVHLTFVYPRWQVSAAEPVQFIFPAMLVIMLIALWFLRRRSRAPLAAVLLFGAALFPALGFVDVYPFRYSYVADHFQYHASIALIVLAAAGIARFAKQHAIAAFAIIAVPLAVLTSLQSREYRSGEALYRATLERNPNAWMAHNNLGMLLANDGRYDEAREHFVDAVRLNPRIAEHHMNLGRLALGQGALPEAIRALTEAVRLEPGAANAHSNLGVAMLRQGDMQSAIEHFEMALRINPSHQEAALNIAAAHQALGVGHAQAGRLEAAVSHFGQAAQYNPMDAGVQYNLGAALVATGQLPEGVRHLEAALRINPQLEAAQVLLQRVRQP